MPQLHPLEQLDAARFDMPAILKKLANSSRQEYENVGLIVHPPQKAKSPGEPTEAMTPTRNPQST